MANINIKFNGKEFLLSCDDGQEEHLEELSLHLNNKFDNLKKSLGNIGENKLLLITSISVMDEYFETRKKIEEQKNQINIITEKFKELKSLVYEYKDEKEKEVLKLSENQAELKNDLESQMLSYENLVDKATLEIENFINSEEGKTQLAEQYNVQHILLSVKSGSTEKEIEEIEVNANSLISRLNDGENFEKLAASFSAGQNALEGGYLGWRTEAELPSLFAEAVTGLKVGEIASPLRSGAGFHILKLIDKRGNTVKFLDQTLARHILVQPSEIRTENQAEELINTIYERLTSGEDFKQLARQYSEDPGTKMDGGELGWSNPGDYDPAFEQTLNATKIGELSKPVKSSFGWHVIEVMDRRNEDVSQEEQKDRAFRIIFDRKFEQELQSTLIELRAEAYVDIKLNS